MDNKTKQQTASNPLEHIVMWTAYTDATKHPELINGKKYCVNVGDGMEVYAKFVVYGSGEECDFLCLHTNKSLNVNSFRMLDLDLDKQSI